METQIILLSGFLGAGKTTLLNHFLAELQGQRVGVIVNEFGKLDVDSELTSAETVARNSLTSGSIFCSCLEHDFEEALHHLLGIGLTAVLIEASGLSDPSSIRLILDRLNHRNQTSSPLLRIGVVDAVHFARLLSVLPVLGRQVVFSDLVFLNKTQLDPQATAAARAKLAELVPGQLIYDDLSSLRLADLAPADPVAQTGEPSSNTGFQSPKAVILRQSDPIEPDKLQHFLQALAQIAFRVKGFVETPQGWIFVSAVGGHLDLKVWHKPVAYAWLTVIVLDGMRDLGQVYDLLADTGIGFALSV